MSEEEKKAYTGNIKATGSYQGYKLRQYWVLWLSSFGNRKTNRKFSM